MLITCCDKHPQQSAQILIALPAVPQVAMWREGGYFEDSGAIEIYFLLFNSQKMAEKLPVDGRSLPTTTTAEVSI